MLVPPTIIENCFELLNSILLLHPLPIKEYEPLIILYSPFKIELKQASWETRQWSLLQNPPPIKP